jgi:hypothetical protein
MRRAALAGVLLLLFVRTDLVSAQSATTPTIATTGLVLAPGRFAAGADVLVWWYRASPTPVPLVTDGLVGDPGTQVFLGGGSVDTGANTGFRINAGYGLSARSALEGNFFYFPRRSTTAGVSSSGKLGSVDLIIPSIDALTGQESGTEISLAPIYKGIVTTEFSNELWGAEVNGAWSLAPASSGQLDVIGGFRYLRLNEKYSMNTDSSYNPPFPQDIWLTNDSFETTNNFYGVQAGLRARFDQGNFFAVGTAKVALGAMAQKVVIDGSLVTNDYTDFGPTVTYPGAYFALPTNMGSYTRTVFAAVPEVNLNVGWRVTPAATITLGYSFLYASNVVRPGNQISRNINWTQTTAYTEDPNAKLTGPAQPQFQYNDSSFWAQGINVGLAVRF